MRELGGRAALVTGATAGVGAELAGALARRGVRVALSGRDVEALERLAGRLCEAGGVASAVPADLADLDAADMLVARAERAVGGLDVLVNNAAIEITAAYTELTRDELERYALVNLVSPMLLIRRALPGMLARGRGHVVNVASLGGKGAIPYQGPYGATKAGLVGLTRSLRAEYRDAPVGFSVVCPGFIEGEGMYGRMVEQGFRAPRTLSVSPMSATVDAVLTAIREDRPELIVTPRPLRPLFALAELFPALGERVVDRLGARQFFGAVARDRGRAGAASAAGDSR